MFVQQVSLAKITATYAWNVTSGSTNVVVAVIDWRTWRIGMTRESIGLRTGVGVCLAVVWIAFLWYAAAHSGFWAPILGPAAVFQAGILFWVATGYLAVLLLARPIGRRKRISQFQSAQ